MIQRRYVFGERRTFVYDNPFPCEIAFYIGQIIDTVTEEPLREYARDATFVCFDNEESATRVVKRPYWTRLQHERVLPASYYLYDAGLDEHLVVFPRFHGFLSQADLTFLASLEDPIIPGYPKDVVRREIRALIEALEYMLSEGVSSSLLHLPIGYVWSSGKLKIIMLEVDDKEDHTSVEWNKIKARNLKRFGTGLDKYVLNTTVAWPEKDSFLRCFSIRLEDENRRLPLIRNCLFLKKNPIDSLRIFTRVHRALRRNLNLENLNVTKLMVALNSKQFKSEFMPNGEWTRPDMSPQFHAFLRGDPQGDSIKYDTREMGELVRYLRNVFENGGKNGMRVDFIFNEVGRLWPHLIDRFHEKLSGWYREQMI